eukprot:SAG25_NODE_2222_length_1824_cov_0.979130_2_plen_224_part_00
MPAVPSAFAVGQFFDELGRSLPLTRLKFSISQPTGRYSWNLLKIAYRGQILGSLPKIFRLGQIWRQNPNLGQQPAAASCRGSCGLRSWNSFAGCAGHSRLHRYEYKIQPTATAYTQCWGKGYGGHRRGRRDLVPGCLAGWPGAQQPRRWLDAPRPRLRSPHGLFYNMGMVTPHRGKTAHIRSCPPLSLLRPPALAITSPLRLPPGCVSSLAALAGVATALTLA